jgi:hypothetical protein
MGDLNFLTDIIENDRINELLKKKWYPECLYLLAMTDYLCRENNLPINDAYSNLRQVKLDSILYPAGILTLCAVLKDDTPKQQSLRDAIPEFLRHNIVESEVRNVV